MFKIDTARFRFSGPPAADPNAPASPPTLLTVRTPLENYLNKYGTPSKDSPLPPPTVGVTALTHECTFEWNSYTSKDDPIRGMISVQAGMDVQPISGDLKLAIIWVLDISGSMEKNQRLAMAKSAVSYALEKTPVGHKFCVITFESKVEVLVPMQVQTADKQSSAQAVTNSINPLKTKEATDLCGGVIKALDEVLKLDTTKEIPQIILLTDGEPTAGVTDHGQILENVRAHPAWPRVSLTCVGCGTGVQYELLNSLSSASCAGAVWSVDQSEKIPGVIGGIFGSLTTTAARDLELAIFSDRLTIFSSGGGQVVRKANHHVVRWSRLAYQQTRHVLFEMKGVATDAKDMLIAVMMGYLDLNKNQEIVVTRGFFPSFTPVPYRQFSETYVTQKFNVEAASYMLQKSTAKLEEWEKTVRVLPASLQKLLAETTEDVQASIRLIKNNETDRLSSYARATTTHEGASASGYSLMSRAAAVTSKEFAERCARAAGRAASTIVVRCDANIVRCDPNAMKISH